MARQKSGTPAMSCQRTGRADTAYHELQSQIETLTMSMIISEHSIQWMSSVPDDPRKRDDMFRKPESCHNTANMTTEAVPYKIQQYYDMAARLVLNEVVNYSPANTVKSCNNGCHC